MANILCITKTKLKNLFIASNHFFRWIQFHHNANLNGDFVPQTLQSYQFSKRNTPISGKGALQPDMSLTDFVVL